MGNRPKVDKQNFIQDIRAGMNREDLRHKYQMTPTAFQNLLSQLQEQGSITNNDLSRMGVASTTADSTDRISRPRTGACESKDSHGKASPQANTERPMDDFKQRFLNHQSVPVVAPVVLILIVSGLLANHYAGDAGVMFWVMWVILGVLIGFVESKLQSDARVKAKLATLLPSKFFKRGSNAALAFRCAIIVGLPIAFVMVISLVRMTFRGLGADVAGMETLATLAILGVSIWALVHFGSRAKNEKRIREVAKQEENQLRAAKAASSAEKEAARRFGATASSQQYKNILDEERARDAARYQLEVEKLYKEHPKLRDEIPTYGFWAYFSFFFFMPFAVVAVHYSRVTKQALSRGETLEALRASVKTRNWIAWTITTGVLLFLFIIKYSK